MRYYAIFVNGVRGGTVVLNNSESGEELKQLLINLSPTLSIRHTDETDNFVREIKNLPKKSNIVQNTCGIGGQMVKAMIEAYEGRVR